MTRDAVPEIPAAVAPSPAADRSVALPGWAGRLLAGTVPAVAVAVACLTFGRWQFGGFDHSALIDVGWRLAQGQRPYVDFPCTVPVWWMEAIGLAFRWLGPSWWTVVVLQAAFAGVSYAWTFWLLELIWPRVLWSLLVALALQAGSNLITSYWWYNTLTTMAACIYHLSLVALALHPRRRATNVSCVLAMTLLAGCKPNVALPLLLASGPLLVLATRSFTRAAALVAATVALTWAGLALAGISPVQVWNSYRDVAGRGLTLQTLVELIRLTPSTQVAWMASLAGECVAVALAVMVLFRGHRTLPGIAAVVTGAAAVIAVLTNGENKLVDLTIMLCATWATYAAGRRAGAEWRRVPRPVFQVLACCIAALCLVWTGYGLALSASRDRVRAIGPFYAPTYSARRPSTPFFAGLQASDEFIAVEEQLAHALKTLEPASVFFGPRLQWAYAAFGLPSPLREPVWWHGGVSYGSAKEGEMVKAWRDNAHDVLIFYRNERIYIPDGLIESMPEPYLPAEGLEALTLLVTRAKAARHFPRPASP